MQPTSSEQQEDSQQERHSRFTTFPNASEITKSTLPLLATVLAGFGVTIITQILSLVTGGHAIAQTLQSASQRPTFIALLFITVAIPCLLAATFYSMWANASSYQHLTAEALKVLGSQWTLDELEELRYFDDQQKRWWLWYRSAVWSFSIGTGLFAIGVCIELAVFLGMVPVLLFIFATAIWVVWLIVGRWRLLNSD